MYKASAWLRFGAGRIFRPRLVALLWILAAAPAQGEAPVVSLLPPGTRYRMQPNDVVELSFRFTPEFNQTVTIQPDGYVPLLGAGEICLAGLTVPEATAAVIRKYGDILHDAVVTLILKEFHRPSYMVLGHVARPGTFDLHANTRLLDAIAAAGGCLPGARTSEVVLVRRVTADTVEVKVLDVYPPAGPTDSTDVVLRAGDAVYVSTSIVGKIDRFLSVAHLAFYIPIPGLR